MAEAIPYAPNGSVLGALRSQAAALTLLCSVPGWAQLQHPCQLCDAHILMSEGLHSHLHGPG